MALTHQQFDLDGEPNPNYTDTYANLPDLSHLFDRKHWKRQGEELVRAHKSLTDQWQWDVGDWLLLGEVFGRLNYDDDKELRSDVEKITERAWQTIKNYKVVSKAFPKPSSLRRDGISYSIYPLLTKFHDPADKEKALDRAVELKAQNRLTIKGFEKEIERMQREGQLPQDEKNISGEQNTKGEENTNGAGDQDGSKVTVTIEGPLKRETLERLEAVAFKRYDKHQPNRLIWEMAFRYWGDHKEQLESMSKNNDPMLKHPNPLP